MTLRYQSRRPRGGCKVLGCARQQSAGEAREARGLDDEWEENCVKMQDSDVSKTVSGAGALCP